MATTQDTMFFNIYNLSIENQKIGHSLLLLGSPIPVIVILVVYMIFVFKWGPYLMRNREPYNLKLALLFYNGIQVIYNGFIFYKGASLLFILRIYNFLCIESLDNDHPQRKLEIFLVHMYFLNKVLDLADTVFFVLRKNFRQVTVLHVYHHIMMVSSGYFIDHFYGLGGHSVMMGVLNVGVHTFMYAYYFVSVLKPEIKQNLRWKKVITQLQLGQFFIVGVHSLLSLLTPNCGYPRSLILLHLIQSIILTFMFANFYIKNYINVHQASRKVK